MTTKKNTRKMGSAQIHMLNSMVEHETWHRGAGWVWTNYSTSERLLRGLEERGFVERTPHAGWRRDVWTVTEAGREERKRLAEERRAGEQLRKQVVDTLEERGIEVHGDDPGTVAISVEDMDDLLALVEGMER